MANADATDKDYVQPGRINRLPMVDIMPQGAYLKGDEVDPRILLPKHEIPKDAEVGDELDVFLYFDSEDRIVATMSRPKAMLGDYAYLKVVGVTSFGAFVDWGLPKDLLVPNSEQEGKMQEGRSYLVKVKQDRESDLLIGSCKEKYFFDDTRADYRAGDRVSLLPYRRTPLGTQCLIDRDAIGMLFADEAPETLPLGRRLDGSIKRVRPDGKIDLQIRNIARANKRTLADDILLALKNDGGFLPLSDSSSPAEIHARFQVSKKKFKLALSQLYKERKIEFTDDGIRSL